MNVSWKWLQDYVDLDGLTPQEVADRMTLTSLEEEGIKDLSEVWKNIVVAKIQKVEKHEDADRLRVVTVDIGGGDTHQIVCGGTNIAEGMDPVHVPLALPGAIIDGTEIKKAKVRGVASEGMLCGPDELGQDSKSDREIWILPEDVEPGTPLAEALGVDDIVIDFDVLPNRPDCMGHKGVAREIAAVFERELNETWPDIFVQDGTTLEELKTQANDDVPLKVQVKDDEACRRYSAIVMSGIDTRESPEWLKAAVRAVGVRPINAIVDMTNYMMFDVAQPFHAFDYDRIAGKEMTVRGAKEGEVVRTLDGIDRELPKGGILIEDKDGPMDLAGIMGGERTSVHDETTRIILQTAHFDAFTIRRTSREMGHRTDAVSLFEKGIDAHKTLDALEKAAALLKGIFPEITIERVIDIEGALPEQPSIVLRNARLNSYLGTELSREDVRAILERLECEMTHETEESLTVTPPTHRLDLHIEEDIIEEVARVFGYDKLPFAYMVDEAKPPKTDPAIHERFRLRETLAGVGMHEVVNYAFLGKDLLAKISIQDEPHIEVQNPLDERQAVMRTELLSGLLEKAASNTRFEEEFRLFEVGKVYFEGKDWKKDGGADERWAAAGLIIYPEKKSTPEQLYRETRGIIEHVLNEWNVQGTFERMEPDAKTCPYWTTYHPGRSAQVVTEDHKGAVATLTEIPPQVLRAYDIEGIRIGAFTISVDGLLASSEGHKTYEAFSVFPPMKRDISFVVPESTSFDEIQASIQKNGGEYLSSAHLIGDVYRDPEKLGEGKKTLTFRLTFQAEDKTLQDIDVKEHIEIIEKALG